MSRRRKRTGIGPPKINPAVTIDREGFQPHREHLGRGPMRGARRTTPRTKAVLQLITGEKAGTTFDILTRDSAEGGVAFMLKEPIPVGQAVRLLMNAETAEQDEIDDEAGIAAEITRSRAISNGRFEMAAKFR